MHSKLPRICDLTLVSLVRYHFLPRDASAERGYMIAFVCPSVRLSVRSGTVITKVGILRK